MISAWTTVFDMTVTLILAWLAAGGLLFTFAYTDGVLAEVRLRRLLRGQKLTVVQFLLGIVIAVVLWPKMLGAYARNFARRR